MMYDIKMVTLGEPEYPALLKYIKDPPKQLYYTGDISLASKHCFAVVGSRKCTDYGKWVAHKIGQRFAENNICLVSGMADGIDSYGHRGALLSGGKTIAVFGCGIDICFPAKNKKLMAEIAKTGLILSEYPEGYPPAQYTFPRRNRIISGISSAVVVVEAGISSGSLITAELAGEQGREVYAVPGNITNVMSIGTNKLIRDGATSIAVIDDLFWDFGIEKIPNKIFVDDLGDEEKIIVKAIENCGELTVDQLSSKTGIQAGKVNGIVTVLEMKGIISTTFGKVFIAK